MCIVSLCVCVCARSSLTTSFKLHITALYILPVILLISNWWPFQLFLSKSYILLCKCLIVLKFHSPASPSSVCDVVRGWTVAPSTSPGLQLRQPFCAPFPDCFWFLSRRRFPSFDWSFCLSLSVALFLFFDKQLMRWHGWSLRLGEQRCARVVPA